MHCLSCFNRGVYANRLTERPETVHGIPLASFLLLVASLFLVAVPGARSSVLAPDSKARSR